jgi:DNA repair photolyase
MDAGAGMVDDGDRATGIVDTRLATPFDGRSTDVLLLLRLANLIAEKSVMATVIKARRKSAVLTPSKLPCLSAIPTVNLTVGCLHGCLYCYARSYRQFPGDGKIVLYENTLESLRGELARRRDKPRAVYFSPSSDLFQPVSEVLELGEAVIRFLFENGIGVAFVSKGHIPDHVLALLCERADLVRAQIGIITLDERIARPFEPNTAPLERRLAQMEALVRAGVSTEARVDLILPGVTDDPAATDRLFAALAAVGIKRAAVDVLFLRPAIVQSLRRHQIDRQTLARLLGAFPWPPATGTTSHRLSREVRREMFDRVRNAAAAQGIEASVCACENPDLARGTCNITGRWPKLPQPMVQYALLADGRARDVRMDRAGWTLGAEGS